MLRSEKKKGNPNQKALRVWGGQREEKTARDLSNAQLDKLE